MPPSVLDPFSAAERLLISGLLRQGVSFNRIINTGRGMGFLHRRTTWLGAIRHLGDMVKREAAALAAPHAQLFPVSAMVPTDLRRGMKYRVYFRIEGYNAETGTYFTKVVSAYDNTRRSKQEWEERYLADRGIAERYPTEEIYTIKTVSVEHQKGFPY